MFSVDFLLALGIGLLVMCAVYIGLRRVIQGQNLPVRRAVAVFSGVAGIIVTLFLWAHPDVLEQQSLKIVLALIGVLLAFIALIKNRLK